MRRRTVLLLFFIALLGAAAIYIDWPTSKGIHIGGYNNNLTLQEGLDLQGGVQIVMQATCPTTNPKCDIASHMSAVVDNVQRRVVGGLAVNDPVVRQQVTLPNIIAIPGGLPIKAGGEVIGGAGVSGTPGVDEGCVQAGLDKVADQLK